MHLYTFPKAEHIVSKLEIESLFLKENKAVNSFPLRMVYREVDDCEFPSKVIISVSKRHFKHAVDRNRAKRQIREAYRLQKHMLWNVLQKQNKKLHIAFIWLSDKPVDSQQVKHSMEKIFNKVILKYEAAFANHQ